MTAPFIDFLQQLARRDELDALVLWGIAHAAKYRGPPRSGQRRKFLNLHT